MTMLRLSRAFACDRRGVSAVEFAMLLPLMLTLYFGTVEISQGVSIDRKVTLTARTITDLVTQSSSVNKAGLDNFLKASSSIMTPYPTSTLKATMSAVTIDATGKATVEWSRTLNGTERSGEVTQSIPEALRVANTQLIWGEVNYDYTPTIGYVITGTLPLSEQIFMRPRVSDKVTCADCKA